MHPFVSEESLTQKNSKAQTKKTRFIHTSLCARFVHIFDKRYQNPPKPSDHTVCSTYLHLELPFSNAQSFLRYFIILRLHHELIVYHIITSYLFFPFTKNHSFIPSFIHIYIHASILPHKTLLTYIPLLPSLVLFLVLSESSSNLHDHVCPSYRLCPFLHGSGGWLYAQIRHLREGIIGIKNVCL